MIYFEILSVALGAWMVLGGAWAALSVESLRRLTMKVYPETRPRWMPVVGMVVLVLVLWTWIEFARAASMENFVVTLVMSLALMKVAPMVFFYKKSREFLMALVAEPLALRVVALSSASVGVALLVMGIFF
ncbi:MAG: hypothetical protein V1882_04270 [Candidatus Omnitrophota bacterium]